MSRSEKKAIAIADKVKVSLQGSSVTVEGPKGTLKKDFPSTVTISIDDAGVWTKANDESRQTRAMVGTVHSLICGMMEGVLNGFSKELEISGVGFKAALKGNALDLSLGTSHPIIYNLPAGIKVSVQEGVKIKVEGIDKRMVGQVAADIKAFYPMEPYKGKGVRIVGEFVRRKEGKKTA